ncbi:dTDP-glucose 4,6-dehydratase [Rhizobium sp. 1399]|uniref:dTDP-glucose 4,6-dehydratase n=1 Tax=Rhizobium sp. 1399 TaxID=2817758 RepID=UPI00285778D6|nr:dTDP-glucose 4,6-dehydratase [Rhizobium sp. 1399]MDR6671387.1 dTDP-glucose 4,6-dehydratase [Rhizobium sp. 1399]
MTILVTGGAGFIGSNFVLSWLTETSEPLINLDKLTYAGNLDNLATVSKNPDYIFVRGDIGDASLVPELLAKHKPRAIVNFAAESHVDRSIKNPSDFVLTNVVGTFNLLEATKAYWTNLPISEKEAFRFLHISTDEVYGSLTAEAPAFAETNRYEPNSPYSASKAASDHFARAYFHTYGLPVITTNCSNNYGPFQFPEKLIPLCVHRALSNEPLPIYGDGKQIRDWLHVADHCSAIRAVLTGGAAGATYNIGGNEEKTNLQVVGEVCKILDDLRPRTDGHSYERQIEFVADRPGHDRRYAINAHKIEQELGWTPTETFASGLRSTIRWYLDNQTWIINVTTGNYQNWMRSHYGVE